MISDKHLLNPAFARDKFLLKQKHFSFSEKYYVWDEQGEVILFIERPSHLLQNLGAAGAGIIAAFCRDYFRFFTNKYF